MMAAARIMSLPVDALARNLNRCHPWRGCYVPLHLPYHERGRVTLRTMPTRAAPVRKPRRNGSFLRAFSQVIWLSKEGNSTTSPITGQATLTPEQAQQFAAGEWYVNVHTQAHPAGETRDQVVPQKS
jgi:hypothetical protein